MISYPRLFAVVVLFCFFSPFVDVYALNGSSVTRLQADSGQHRHTAAAAAAAAAAPPVRSPCAPGCAEHPDRLLLLKRRRVTTGFEGALPSARPWHGALPGCVSERLVPASETWTEAVCLGISLLCRSVAGCICFNVTLLETETKIRWFFWN